MKFLRLGLGQFFKKIISAFNDFGVYEKSEIKFEGHGDQEICYRKPKFLKIDKNL